MTGEVLASAVTTHAYQRDVVRSEPVPGNWSHRSGYGRASCDDARLMTCIVDEMVQCSPSSCCLSSHVKQPGAFEQPIQESLPRTVLHAVRTT
jgi:hypothetical protein